jgi:hypothetical protein
MEAEAKRAESPLAQIDVGWLTEEFFHNEENTFHCARKCVPSPITGILASHLESIC